VDGWAMNGLLDAGKGAKSNRCQPDERNHSFQSAAIVKQSLDEADKLIENSRQRSNP